MTLFYSTISNLNKALTGGAGTLRIPTLRSTEADLEPRDGLVDRLELNMVMPLIEGESVHSIKAFIFVQVKLSRWARISVPCLLYAEHASPLPGASLLLDAHVAWRQTRPLPPRRGGFRTPYGPLLDPAVLLPWDDGNQTLQDFLPNLIASYRERNFTSSLVDTHALWSSAGGAVGHVQGSGKGVGSFNLTATLRVPMQPVTYTPGVSEVAFDAWVKYLAMGVVVAWLLDNLLSFVFHHHMVPTHEHVEGQTDTHGPRYASQGALGRFKAA